MTANQVAYWQLQESKRHNAITESNERDRNAAQATRWNEQSRIESGNLSVNQRKADIAGREADIKQQANYIHMADTAIKGVTAIGKIASMFV